MLAPPAVEFAQHDGTHLAYQGAGIGPPDLVFVGGSFATTLAWDEHAPARAFRRLASFSRLITYDQRGMGFSDPIDPSAVPTVDDLVSDLVTVIAAAGASPIPSSSACTTAPPSPPSTPPGTRCSVWSCATVGPPGGADDYPIGFGDDVLDHLEERYRNEWGQGTHLDVLVSARAPTRPRRRRAQLDQPEPGGHPLPDEP